jgi:SAM-dependent methyltransferase
VIAAHFIEHLRDPRRAIEFLADRLAPGGRAYLEWPHAISTRMPPSKALQDRGTDVSTTRFDDDGTHICPWPMQQIVELCERRSLRVESWAASTSLSSEARSGTMGSPAVTVQTSRMGFVWSIGWAQYLVVSSLR